MNRYYIFMILAFMVISGCTRSGEEDMSEKEVLSFSAGVHIDISAEPGLMTRAGEPDFPGGFDLFVEHTSVPSGVTNVSGKYNAVWQSERSEYNVSGASGFLYWDDMGGNSAAVSLQGIYPKGAATGMNSLENESEEVNFIHEVRTDQNTGNGAGFTASDLQVSSRNVGYTLDKQKNSVQKELTFNHVMSKMTVIVTLSEGFDATNDSPKLTLKEMATNARVTFENPDNAPAVEVDVTPGNNEITPRELSSTVVGGKRVVTFEAIVVPGQTIQQGSAAAIAEIKVNGIDEKYQIDLPAATFAHTEFQSGCNYQLKVTVTKTNTIVVGKLIGWTTHAEELTKEVGINLEGGLNEGGGTEEPVAGAQLFVDISKKHKVLYTYDPTALDPLPQWPNAGEKVFWDDIKMSEETPAQVDAFLYNGTETEYKNAEKVYVQEDISLKKPVNSIGFAGLSHPMAQIVVKIRTVTERGGMANVDMVELSELKNLKFHSGIKEFKEVTIENPATAAGTTRYWEIVYDGVLLSSPLTGGDILRNKEVGTEKYDYYYSSYTSETVNKFPAFYVKPGVTIPALATLVEFDHEHVNSESAIVKNTYPLKLTNALELKANTIYVIEVTLHKKEVAQVGVSMKPWGETDPIGGDAGIIQ